MSGDAPGGTSGSGEDRAGVAGFVSGTLVSVGIKGVSAGLSYLVVVLLARWLSAEEYGRYAAGFSLASIAGVVAMFGQPNALLRYLGEYAGTDRLGRLRGVFRAGLGVTALGSLVVAALLGALGLVRGALGAPGQAGYLLGAAALTMALAWAEVASSVLRSAGSIVGALLPRDVLWKVLVLAVVGASVALLDRSPRAWEVLLASAVLLMVLAGGQLAAGWRWIRARTRGAAPVYETDLWRPTWLGLWGVTTVTAIAAHVDVVLVEALMDPDSAGRFFAASRTAALLTLSMIGINTFAAPLVAEFVHGGERARLERLLTHTALVMLATVMGGMSLFVFFGGPLLSIMGSAYVEAQPILVVVGLGFSFSILCGPVAMMLMMAGLQGPLLRALVVVTAVALAAKVWLITTFGLEGAAWGSVLHTVGWNVTALWLVVRHLEVDPSVLGLRRLVGGRRG